MHSNFFENYSKRLTSNLFEVDWSVVSHLANDMLNCWNNENQIFLCGNGGSAGNASHLANDFIYGVAKKKGKGIKAISLCANTSVLTCLANDVGYESIFSEQLAVLAKPNDILLALSGSGNSSNIISAINEAKLMGVTSYAITGFDGGKARLISDYSIHFNVNDMQLSEDFQIIVGHMLMQWLFKSKQK